MPGRKPKPTALKIAEGNPGKRRLNAHEPKPLTEAPPCPPHLAPDAKEEWDRIVPLLLSLSLLAKCDLAALACYCTAWGRHVRAEREMAGQCLTQSTANGNLIINSLIGVSNTSAKLAHKFLTEFGLTPSTRSRLTVAPAEKTKTDELREFLNDQS